MRAEFPVVVLGGGLAGLATAHALGPHAVVLEREERPGGLVRTVERDGYWFDHVLHLLYCPDEDTRGRVDRLLGSDLGPCPPEAFVETAAGTTRFPLQSNLCGLETETVATCLRDLAEVTFGPRRDPEHFEDLLLSTYGRALCDLFLLPYNRKIWKRPLSELTADGFQWNLARPPFEVVVRGALGDTGASRPYNAAGTYPRPPAGAPVRGMELLSVRLAEQVVDLRRSHRVTAIDLEERVVHVDGPEGPGEIRWTSRLVSTLPLPLTIGMCAQAPEELRREATTLPVNRVYNAMFSVRGPRPSGTGLWRYYADPDLVFHRLAWMHAFDPLTAPPDGWGVMAEMTQRVDGGPVDEDALLARARRDLDAAGVLGPRDVVVDQHLVVADPAYVVFTPAARRVVGAAAAFLRSHGVEPLGRYGRWEYSSMGQVMRDGFALGDALRAGLS